MSGKIVIKLQGIDDAITKNDVPGSDLCITNPITLPTMPIRTRYPGIVKACNKSDSMMHLSSGFCVELFTNGVKSATMIGVPHKYA